MLWLLAGCGSLCLCSWKSFTYCRSLGYTVCMFDLLFNEKMPQHKFGRWYSGNRKIADLTIITLTHFLSLTCKHVTVKQKEKLKDRQTGRQTDGQTDRRKKRQLWTCTSFYLPVCLCMFILLFQNLIYLQESSDEVNVKYCALHGKVGRQAVKLLFRGER